MEQQNFNLELKFSHNSTPVQYKNFSLFCEISQAESKTINTNSINFINKQNKMQFKVSNEGNGQVSLKNILISKIKCYYLCRRCAGPELNQYILCFYGTHKNGICKQCPQGVEIYSNIIE
ncbi:unnamed protein product [Paramecium sonneborni]|uniref:Uncharacterized protein n=1 Tax=Paramecium sonneborni TaxID=65129 RepID=A0A8S1RRJ0_9CILI|nr:unnamed protein product [Paramecium sonneborni]